MTRHLLEKSSKRTFERNRDSGFGDFSLDEKKIRNYPHGLVFEHISLAKKWMKKERRKVGIMCRQPYELRQYKNYLGKTLIELS